MEDHTQESNNFKQELSNVKEECYHDVEQELNNIFSNVNEEDYRDVVTESMNKKLQHSVISNIKQESKYEQLNTFSRYEHEDKSNIYITEESKNPDIKFDTLHENNMISEIKISCKEEDKEHEKDNKSFVPFDEAKIDLKDEKIIPENLDVDSYPNESSVTFTHESDIKQTESNQDYADNFCEDSYHMVVHSHNWKFLCKVCGVSFKRKSALTKHLLVHSNERPLQCEHCGKCYKRNFNIYQHMLKVHSLDSKLTICGTGHNNLSCKACGKSFKSKHTFNTHLLMHKVGYCNNVSDSTTSSMLYSCHECKKFFRIKSYLINHMIRIHFKEKGFTCNTCFKSFKTKDYLYKHIVIHNNRKFSCDVCGKSFKTKNTLNAHSLVHSDQFSFHCEHCDNCFKSKYRIYQHIFNVHIQGGYGRKYKNYTCNICDWSFVSEWKLSRHMDRHNNIQKFSCDDCGKKFKRKDQLTRHILGKNHIKIYERKCS